MHSVVWQSQGHAEWHWVADEPFSMLSACCRPPMRGSKLQRKLVAAGRAAAAFGQLAAAAQAWQAAGHWAELLPLLALQGDFPALRSLQHNVLLPAFIFLCYLECCRSC